MFSTSFNEHVTSEGIALNVCEADTDILSDVFTMFVLSLVMASVLAIPAVIGTTQAATMWRMLKKG